MGAQIKFGQKSNNVFFIYCHLVLFTPTKFLKYILPFFNIMRERVRTEESQQHCMLSKMIHLHVKTEQDWSYLYADLGKESI